MSAGGTCDNEGVDAISRSRGIVQAPLYPWRVVAPTAPEQSGAVCVSGETRGHFHHHKDGGERNGDDPWHTAVERLRQLADRADEAERELSQPLYGRMTWIIAI